MQAVVFTHYGSPDVLQLTEVDQPTPQGDEVLVRVHAAAANPLDWHHLRGAPFLVRLADGLRKPKHTILGADIAGRVAAVGSNVTQFAPGDEVFGSAHRLGGFAEYVCTRADAVVLKPPTLSFEHAAAVPVVGFTAIQGLRDTGQLQAGQKVLINGASGGVGTFAVQLARSFGAEVTGVCSTRNVDLVRALGADEVIDYTHDDFTRTGQRYDLIFDAVGNRSVGAYQRALAPDGRCVVAGFTNLARLVQVILVGAWVSRTGTQTIGLMKTAKANLTDLNMIKALLEAGTIVAVIDREYPLAETAEAIRYLEAGHARGKVIITVEQHNG